MTSPLHRNFGLTQFDHDCDYAETPPVESWFGAIMAGIGLVVIFAAAMFVWPYVDDYFQHARNCAMPVHTNPICGDK